MASRPSLCTGCIVLATALLATAACERPPAGATRVRAQRIPSAERVRPASGDGVALTAQRKQVTELKQALQNKIQATAELQSRLANAATLDEERARLDDLEADAEDAETQASQIRDAQAAAVAQNRSEAGSETLDYQMRKFEREQALAAMGAQLQQEQGVAQNIQNQLNQELVINTETLAGDQLQARYAAQAQRLAQMTAQYQDEQRRALAEDVRERGSAQQAGQVAAGPAPEVLAQQASALESRAAALRTQYQNLSARITRQQRQLDRWREQYESARTDRDDLQAKYDVAARGLAQAEAAVTLR